MSTKKLFHEDVYLKKASAKIIGIVGNSLILDQTIFFPTGGGQSCDLGTIDGKEVLEVVEETVDNAIEVFHRLCTKDISTFNIGDTVNIEIDWDRRFLNMQRHCGEHILSGMFDKYFGGVNMGFHMGDDYMTIDIFIDGKSQISKLTYDDALKAEYETNKIIWQDLPVITRRYKTKKEAEGLPLRKPLVFDSDISIVSVGSIDDPSDCVACCGTHPSTSGQVGIVKVYKVEKNKDMFRVYFDAGENAYNDYYFKHEIITDIGRHYSCGTKDLIKKVKANEENFKDTKKQLNILRQSVIDTRFNEIQQQLLHNVDEKIIVKRYKDMNIDSLLNIGRPLCPEISKLLIIISEPDLTVLLFSSGKNFDCGKLVKDNANIYRGKGGGNKETARAIFPDLDMLNTYIDLLHKFIR